MGLWLTTSNENHCWSVSPLFFVKDQKNVRLVYHVTDFNGKCFPVKLWLPLHL
ncbi:hypothetical protein GIB67_024511, partial [Kingdonia uniflora]